MNFCGIPETPSIHHVCQHLTSTKIPGIPKAVILLTLLGSDQTVLDFFQRAWDNPKCPRVSRLIWLPISTSKRIWSPTADLFSLAACDETESHIFERLNELFRSTEANSPLGLGVISTWIPKKLRKFYRFKHCNSYYLYRAILMDQAAASTL